jgi:DNA topoisomerase-1
MDNSDLDIISRLKPSKIVKIMKDPEASAKAVNLIYTSDAEASGIIRKKRGKNIRISRTEKRSKIRTRSKESTDW